ncbi:MAG: prepilin-type N-terminal cleavage/methylation domain-containing protein [Gammaproteobacteria bacterium]|nr:prepilin-type N-terminal cleavage/methylation domain-containing protein [Gammaproteobacteria bacterium]
MKQLRRSVRQRGLSLVELMISLAISSMVTLGLIQMFTANQDTSQLLRGQATLGESGRFAMEMIGRSVRRANYRGCNSKRALEDTIDTVPYEFSLDNGLQGYEGSAGGTWTPDFSTTLMPRTSGATDTNVYAPASETGTGVDLAKLQDGTDVITIWFAGPTEYAVDTAAQALTSGSEAILLEASTTDIAADLAQFHVSFISDCATENMIVITAITNVSGQAQLAHLAGSGVGLTQNLTPIMGTGSGYQDGVVLLPITSHTFYIGESDNVNEFGDPILSLYRKDGISAPIELVEGVEDLEILYGVDTGGEALVPSTYVDASLVSDWRDVIAVRIELVTNSIDDVGSSAADGILRRTFTQTIRLRNRLKKE